MKFSKTTIIAIGLVVALSCIWLPYIVSPYIGMAALIIGVVIMIYGWRFMRG